MVFCKNEDLRSTVKLQRSHGMSAITLDRHMGRSFSYDVMDYGLNYRPDEIRAALGLVQLSKLEAGNQKRKILVDRYHEHLDCNLLSIPFLETSENHVSSYHIMPVLLSEEVNGEDIMRKLKAHGIQTSIHYPNFKFFLRIKLCCVILQYLLLIRFVRVN